MKPGSLDQITAFVNQQKGSGKSIVLVTGVFDILHQEHTHFLNLAKQAGDILIIGLETDIRVKLMKGEARPINLQSKRIKNIKDLNIADQVFLLPEEFSTQQDWEDFIDRLRPDIYAVSSHTKWLKNKRRVMEKFGGKLKIVHQHNPDISSTKIINQKS